MPKKKPKAIISLYRRIAVSFFILTVLLILVVLYFSFAKATIFITPSNETASTNFIINIQDGNKETFADGEVRGKIFIKEFTKKKIFEASGEKKSANGTAGFVTLFNNYSKNQPLVATTRLVSSKGELFRIQNRVEVPAGGKAEGVEVYADNPDEVVFPVAPTRFTIPGLWSGLQELIYAESFEPFSGTSIAVVRPEDIENGREKTKAELLVDAEKEFAFEAGKSEIASSVKIGRVEVLFEESSKKADEEAEDFEYAITANVMALALDEKDLAEYSQKKLLEALPSDRDFGGVDMESLTYTIETYDALSQTVSVNVYVEGDMHLGAKSPLLNKEKFAGMKKKEVLEFLQQSPAIEEADVKFSPFWIRRVPRLLDHIEIVFRRK